MESPASQLPHQLESWLRYYEDLGISTFYRDRVSTSMVAQSTALESEAAAQTVIEAASATPASADLKDSMPTKKVVAAPAASPAVTQIGSVGILKAAGPSLFEAADRVEGDTLERISADLGDCTRCKLHIRRNKIVFGVGNPKAQLVFVGEGPGHDEDIQGIPFVGRAGQLLTQMITAMGLKRDDVYIANVVKCRPPENRTPEKDEVATCMPFLFRQLAVINPKAIVCLGNVAAQALLNTNKGISHYRGQWQDFRGTRLMATYHPAYLLRNPNAKPEVWADLKKVMAFLGLKPPRRDK